mgnify:CR=1 FL=1
MLISFLFVQNDIYFVGETSGQETLFLSVIFAAFCPLFAVDSTVKS